MTLDKVLDELEDTFSTGNESENQLLDENMPIDKTSKEEFMYLLQKMVVLLTMIQGMKQMINCLVYQESNIDHEH